MLFYLFIVKINIEKNIANPKAMTLLSILQAPVF